MLGLFFILHTYDFLSKKATQSIIYLSVYKMFIYLFCNTSLKRQILYNHSFFLSLENYLFYIAFLQYSQLEYYSSFFFFYYYCFIFVWHQRREYCALLRKQKLKLIFFAISMRFPVLYNFMCSNYMNRLSKCFKPLKKFIIRN